MTVLPVVVTMQIGRKAKGKTNPFDAIKSVRCVCRRKRSHRYDSVAAQSLFIVAGHGLVGINVGRHLIECSIGRIFNASTITIILQIISFDVVDGTGPGLRTQRSISAPAHAMCPYSIHQDRRRLPVFQQCYWLDLARYYL
jgi:hypothetical protein